MTEEGDSDKSLVLGDATVPEDMHVEFVDVGDDGWAKLGRRISLSVGLGKPRDRKS